MNDHLIAIAKKLILAALLLGLTACSLPSIRGAAPSSEGGVGEPTYSSNVLSTVPGTVAPNQELTITTVHSYSEIIKEVKFFEDGNLRRVESPPFPQVFFKVDFIWTAPETLKDYTIEIKAYNAEGVELGGTVSKVTVTDTVIAVATQMIAEPTRPPEPTKEIVPGVVACLNDAQLVRHISYSPVATIQPNIRFKKVWLVKNNGTCNWNSGYYLDLVGGSALGAVRTQLPATSAGGEAQLALLMVAPGEGGIYQGQWRIHDLQGRPFGSTLDVEITVPAVCKAPVIKYFAANPTAIIQGQSSTLSWVVEGAKSVSIKFTAQAQSEALSSANTTTDTYPVTPDKTTTYTLEAKDGECVSEQSVTVSVTPQNVLAAPSNLQVVSAFQNGFSLSWQDNSANEGGFRLYNANTHQLLAIFGPNTTSGTAYGLACGSTHHLKLRAFNPSGESTDSNIVVHATLPCN